MEGCFKFSLLEYYLAQRPALQRFLVARLQDEQIAEDILQEMYLKLDRSSYDAPVENPSAFLYSVANNLVRDYRKAAARRRVRDHNWSDSNMTMIGTEPVHDVPDADAALDARRKLMRLSARLNELPPKCRAVFETCKLQGMTYREAAEHHGISIGTVEKHISKALKHLSKYGGGNNDDR